MLVGLDIDGVVADFQNGWINLYEKHFGTVFSEEHRGSWDAFKNTHFKSESDFWEWFDAIHGWAQLPVISGAVGGVYTLQKAGVDFVFVTNRHEKIAGETKLWLTDNLPFAADYSVRHVKHKHFEKDIQVFVEDSPINITLFRHWGRQVVTFNQPWNKHVKAPPHVNDWNSLTNLLISFKDILGD